MEFSLYEKRRSKPDKEKLESILKAFRTEGYVLLKDVFSKTKIKQLHSSLVRDYSGYFGNKEHEDALKVGHKRFALTINIDGDFNSPEIYCNSLILEILGHLLEPNFVISDLTCVVSLPGSKQMHIHRDGTIFGNSPIRNFCLHSLSGC